MVVLTGDKMKIDGERFLKEEIQAVNVAVIGDIMLDKYISGDVDRISPEAPVPINRVRSQRSVLGGAANTAANLSSLGCHVFMAGMLGNDKDGEILSSLLNQAGISGSGIYRDNQYHTTTKVRILGARQQMMRLDFEEKKVLNASGREKILAWLKEMVESFSLGSIILSDYGKGLVTRELAQSVIRMASLFHVPVLVDPKGKDWSKYSGAYGITPNLKELSDSFGAILKNTDEEIEPAGEKLRKTFNISNVFVTRSEKGITCIGDFGHMHCASVAQDVFDVSGAGDTVMAVIAAATASGLDMATTLELANTAAGIAVSKVGTYQVRREEVIDAWCDSDKVRMPYTSHSWNDLKSKMDFWKGRRETVVFTNGCFDILHKGHITYLQKAAKLGNHLIIGLNSDDSVKRLKGERRPINNEMDRAFLLEALRCVDEVVIFDEDTPAKLLSVLRPNILVKGGDYKAEDVVGREFVERVEIIPFVEGYSTTNIIDEIIHK